MTPGPGGSITLSPNNMTPGLNTGLQGGLSGATSQVGLDPTGGIYGETGFGTPGISWTGFYVWNIWDLLSDLVYRNKK